LEWLIKIACRFACHSVWLFWLFSIHKGGWEFAVFGSQVFIGGLFNVEPVDEVCKGFKGRFVFG
jgi:hypothetical protein